jgi:hypothetical protein
LADEAISAVGNSVIASAPWDYAYEDGLTASTDIKPGYVVSWNQSTKVIANAQGVANPNSITEPLFVVKERPDADIDTAFATAKWVQLARIRSGIEVLLHYAADDQSAAVALAPGDLVVVSVQEAGKVMKVQDFATAVNATPTTGGLGDAIEQVQRERKTYVGVVQKTYTGDATNDQIIRVRLE